MIEEALAFVAEREAQLKTIRENSPYFPLIGTFPYEGKTFLATLVRIQKEGVWYTVLCAQDFRPQHPSPEPQAIKKLLIEAYNVKLFWAFRGGEERDICQESEEVRIEKQMGF